MLESKIRKYRRKPDSVKIFDKAISLPLQFVTVEPLNNAKFQNKNTEKLEALLPCFLFFFSQNFRFLSHNITTFF